MSLFQKRFGRSRSTISAQTKVIDQSPSIEEIAQRVRNKHISDNQYLDTVYRANKDMIVRCLEEAKSGFILSGRFGSDLEVLEQVSPDAYFLGVVRAGAKYVNGALATVSLCALVDVQQQVKIEVLRYGGAVDGGLAALTETSLRSVLRHTFESAMSDYL